MDLNLKGKSVVITGGGTGIGRQTAIEFLKEGASVSVIGRREELLYQLQQEVKEMGYDLFYMAGDVTDNDTLMRLAEAVKEKMGGIDIWINNAGIAIDKPFLEFTMEDWNKVVSINMQAVFFGTQIAAKYMMERGGGVILNASSFASKIPHANGVIYAATKAAVSNMTKSTAAALAPYGIRVVGYIPGMIVTPISENMVSSYKTKFTKDISLAKLGHPEDLARPLVFLASEAAGYITGVDVEISGGKFAVQDCDMAWRFKAGESK